MPPHHTSAPDAHPILLPLPPPPESKTLGCSFAEPALEVAVAIDAPVAAYMGESAFMAKLPATPSSLTEMHNITATSGGKQG